MKCPGQDMQFWNESAIYEETCPKCGRTVEFYKDDTNRKCSGCGHRMVNPRLDFGCAAYCQFAEQCLGTLPEEFVGQQDNLLKDRVAVEVKRYLKSDFRRIGHIMRVAQQAEKIARDEGANLGVTLCAAYLLELGEIEAAGRHASPTADQIIDAGQRLAAAILGRLAAKEPIIEGVCTLIKARHRDQGDDSLEVRVLADAAELARLEEMRRNEPEQAREFGRLMAKRLLTASGRQLAQKMSGI